MQVRVVYLLKYAVPRVSVYSTKNPHDSISLPVKDNVLFRDIWLFFSTFKVDFLPRYILAIALSLFVPHGSEFSFLPSFNGQSLYTNNFVYEWTKDGLIHVQQEFMVRGCWVRVGHIFPTISYGTHQGASVASIPIFIEAT